jgi:hypothetical protein
MRPTFAALLLLFACSAGAQQSERNPYVLDVDRAAYRLRIPHGASAAAGGSSPIPAARQSQGDQTQRMRELERERDTWKLHAQQLEWLLIQRGGEILPPRPSPY